MKNEKNDQVVVAVLATLVLALVGLLAVEGWNRLRAPQNGTTAASSDAKHNGHHGPVVRTPAVAVPNSANDHTAPNPTTPPKKDDGILMNE
jgi:hypothetical protein